jgi:hypothetical protein
MRVRITQIDGKLPNVALLKLAHWHKARGDEVVVTRDLKRYVWDHFDIVYGSCLFDFSADRLARFKDQWPEAILGGTGTGSLETVEQRIGIESYEHLDYEGWPEFTASIGFTQRGCRLKCKFCVVPTKEGKNRSNNTIEGIWRGEGFPKHIHLLDNDFFGNPEWRDRIKEIRDGDYRVCLNQGINVRLIDKEAAEALATIKFREDSFTRSRLYTAWDNLRDERVFFKGVDLLEDAGIPPHYLMAYMLIGYDPLETWDRLWHRFNAMVARKIMPYPMVYNRSLRPDLCAFQRWVIRATYKHTPFDQYIEPRKSEKSVEAYLRLKESLT